MEKEILTPGQKAVIDAYLADSEPSATYEAETCILMDTRSIASFLDPMCSFDENDLADYIASKGYTPYASNIDGNFGWILKMKQKTL